MGSGLRWLLVVSVGMALLASAVLAGPMPGESITPDSEPSGIAAGPDGNLWFTENYGDRVGKITPAGVVTE